MADVTVKRTEDFEAIFGGGFRRVRAGLGVSSFGIAVIDLPANFERYPTHDQSHDGQEEVYTLISGSATLRVGDDDGEEYELEPGVWARVGPDEKRKLITGDEPARIIAIGGTPGTVYEPPSFSIEGASAPPLKEKLTG
jgi:mannose-6-phosphate isomerase-like protein (cupin superfamily)